MKIKKMVFLAGILLIIYYAIKLVLYLDVDTKHLAPLKATRIEHKTYLMEDGRVLIYGGYNFKDGNKITVNVIEVFDPQNNTFRITNNKLVEQINTVREVYGITYNIGEIPIRVSNDLYIIRHTYAYIVELAIYVYLIDAYDISTKKWIDNFGSQNHDPTQIVVGLDNKLLILGGSYRYMSKYGSGSYFYFNNTEERAKNGGKVFKSAHKIKAQMHRRRANSLVIRLANGKVLVYGGDGEGMGQGFLKNGELFDPQTETFKFIKGREAVSDGSNLIELKDGSVLITGGNKRSEIIPARKLK